MVRLVSGGVLASFGSIKGTQCFGVLPWRALRSETGRLYDIGWANAEQSCCCICFAPGVLSRQPSRTSKQERAKRCMRLGTVGWLQYLEVPRIYVCTCIYNVYIESYLQYLNE